MTADWHLPADEADDLANQDRVARRLVENSLRMVREGFRQGWTPDVTEAVWEAAVQARLIADDARTAYIAAVDARLDAAAVEKLRQARWTAIGDAAQAERRARGLE